MLALLGRVSADKAWCPNCAETRREVVTFFKIRGNENFLNRALAEIGVPPFDILIARAPREGRSIGLELSWDATDVLGPLSGDAAPRLHSAQIPAASPPPTMTTGTEGLQWT
jgi:hypothetical protein